MFHCKTVVWSLFLWAMVFMYTFFEFQNYQVYWRVLPVVTWTISAIILCALLAKDASNKKSFILALGWSIVVSIGILLYNLDVIDSIALNIHVSVMSGLVAIVWCITSHAEHVTEAGLHWYIWFMLMILTLCCTFNSDQSMGQLIYIFAATISFTVHLIYIWHVFKVQVSGPERCQHIFRILSCLVLTTILLVSSILVRTETISKSHWQETIFAVEIIAGIIIGTDSIIGFTHDPINGGYTKANQNDGV